MPIIAERVATITDPYAVGLAHRLRRLMLASELTVWAAFGAAVALPGETIGSGVLVIGLVGLVLLEMRRGVVGELRRIVGRSRLAVDPERNWLRVSPGRAGRTETWSYDLATANVPEAPLLVPAVFAGLLMAALGTMWHVPLAVGVALVHVTAAGALESRVARSRALTGLAVLGCLAAGRQFLRFSTEEQTRAAAGVVLLLAPMGAGWAIDRPVWTRLLRAPNLRRGVATLARREGATAAASLLPLLLMLLAIVFAYSRGLLLTILAAVALGLAALTRRVAPAVAAGVSALAVVWWLNPPRDRETLALVVLATLAGLLAVRHAWPRAWVVAALTAGAFHVIAVRPYVTAVFALAFAVIGAMPRREAPAAQAAEASSEPARTA